MRVLILSARTGGGHMRAAQALEEAIKERDGEACVEVVDGLEYVNHYYSKLLVDGYKFSAMKLPKVYGVFYRASNNDKNVYKLVQKTNSHYAKRFIPLLARFQPDVIVSTHPFMSIMVSRLIEKGITNIPLVSIITDFAPHISYINQGVSQYIVSSVQMVDELEKLGVDRNIINPTGIPIQPIFFEKDENKEKTLGDMGFDPNLKTVLIMAGSFGVTDILKIYENINELDIDFQIIVITGKNPKLFDAFNSLLSCSESFRVGQPQPNFDDEKESARKQEKINITKKTKLIYFTDEVYKYMHVADLIITKPGGLTVTEALASCLPMALFKGIPGQETENTEYLCNNNLAISIKKSTAAEVVFQLLKYPERLISMRESCQRLNNPDSANKVVDVIERSIREMTEPKLLPTTDDLNPETDMAEDEELYDEFSRVVNDFEYEEPRDIPDELEDYFEEKLQKLKEQFKKITDFSIKKNEEE